MERTFYVTTPIYYVNAEPHIGHAYTTILADFMTRLYTLTGHDSYFLTGTDEHGDKIFAAASANNTTPQEYSDRISGKFRAAWDDIGIRYSDFIRTTEARHKKVVQDILQKVYDSGDIYFGSYGGNYCVGCERFLTDKEIVDGKCPEHNREPQFIEEKNYFFKMSKYQDWLIDHINKNPEFIRPERYKNEVLSMLKGEVLEDLCISRPVSRLTWGIPLPFDENFVTYVWFDALINYVSAMGYPDDQKFKNYWPSVQHIIAKDILKPHGIFWPTMLKAAGIEPYINLNVHGYWNMDDAKMSKSLGNVVTPHDLVNKYGNDQIRYFFLREMTFGLDARFNEDVVIDRINYDLANDLGNLVNRTFNMAGKFFEGKVPGFGKENPGRDEMLASFEKAASAYIEHASKFQTSIGIEKLWEFIRSLNKYVDEHKPWQLAKEGKNDELASVMRNLLEAIYSVAVLLSPVLITISPKIVSALNMNGISVDIKTLTGLNNLKSGSDIGDPGILFPKMEKPKAETKAEPAKEVKKEKETAGLIEITDFTRVDIRVAEILEASKVEGSDKLLYLKVNSGLDERFIVAGIAQAYSPEEVKGKKILLVANLKPAKIFGIESNGMLLAAKKSSKDKPAVIFVDDSIPAGAKLG
ncbi:MAG TPA: methionine--tRNA ligase [Spirochaetota bacterium]|nr:methionine--tRNA ligase [Spirochaetota bacterium]HPJ41238.1 methionine--tRNA ligase [Spirochaetota bacterium]HPR36555.1 methionine--tRNA ligase [Spirochaetota bacterium]HRX46303.1 methionine--tRNA ligase [Spirochaetota bacterium]